MRLLALISLLLVAAAAPAPQDAASDVHYGRAHAPKRRGGTVRIGAYNVLNLFDERDDPALSGDIDDVPKPASQREGVAKAIRELDADILALEEVESEAALVWFRDTYLEGMGYDHVASRDVGYYRGVECSVLSRFPIERVEVRPDVDLAKYLAFGPGWTDPSAEEQGRPLRYQRSPLLVEIRLRRDYAVTLLVVHHKAGREFSHTREAEARATAAWVLELEKRDAAVNVLVLGDFNAAPWDKSVRTYLASGLTDAFAQRSTATDDPESLLWRTHVSNRVLDYVLMNRGAFRELVVGSPFVLGTPSRGPDDPRETPDPPGFASDHFPIAIELVPRNGN